MKTPLKLLMVIAVIVTIAAPAGWKWGPKQKLTRALTYAVAPADATAPDSITPPDTSVNPDGWTWDTGE
jgi:hypothetical protein